MNKRKQYFHNRNTKQQKFNLEVGLRGFLCSCNNREKDCIREAYNILNKHVEKLCVPKETPVAKQENCIEDDLTQEIEQLKSENTSPHIRKFQVVESGAKNFLFIRTTVEDPVQLATMVIKEISETKEQQTRFLLRLVPIDVTCKAYIEDVKISILPLLKKYFSSGPKTYSIAFNHRNNNSLIRDEVIKVVAELVGELPEKHIVNLNEPELTIVIEAIKKFAFLSVIPDYIKYKKFNLHAFCDKPIVLKEETDVKDVEDKTVIEAEIDENEENSEDKKEKIDVKEVEAEEKEENIEGEGTIKGKEQIDDKQEETL